MNTLLINSNESIGCIRCFLLRRKEKENYTLDQIHKITESSKDCWSNSVIEDRKERL
jgi:hypothetical protein